MKRKDFLKTALITSALANINNTLKADTLVDKDKKYVNEESTDIVIVGSGPAGIPAAIAAAREGAKVVLLEQDSMVGGAPINMFVTFICGLPHLGIFKEMLNALQNKYPIKGDIAGQSGIWFFPNSFTAVLERKLAHEKNIKIIRNAAVNGVIMSHKGNKPKILGVEYVDGEFKKSAVKAKIVIDATGSGLVSELAGAKCMYGRDAKEDFGEKYARDKRENIVMPCTQMVILQRFRENTTPIKKVNGWVDSGVGFLVSVKDDSLIRQNTYQYLSWQATMPCKDTRNPLEVAKTQAELLNKKILPKFDEYWQWGYAMHIAPKLGIRESRRVLGEKVITSTDLLKNQIADDSIAHGQYYFDAWGRDDLKEMGDRRVTFGIPYQACVVKGIDNLLMAGKHISGTSLAMSAYRVQPVLAMIGQGVGVCAAQLAKNKTSPDNLDLKLVRKQLQKDGIFKTV